MLFSIESNAELLEQLNSKAHYISLSGVNIMVSHHESSLALYSLTKVLDKSKLTDPEF